MRGSLKLVFGFGLLSVVALTTPACGDDDDGGGSSGSGGGGTGGAGGSGGSGGSSGSAGSAGSAGAAGGTGITCGSNTCTGWKLKDLLPVGPCCAGAAKDKCGADITSGTGALIGVPAGCYETNQPGNVDCTGCDGYTFANPLDPDGGTVTLDGCCLPAGQCGVYVDTSPAPYNGPNIGCLPWSTFGADAGTAKTCTPGSNPPPDGGCPSPSDGGTDASSDASAD